MAPQRRRVLVIPSWYPSTANPLAGSAFQEQAALLQQRYDVRVLFGNSRPLRYTSVLRPFRWLPWRGRARLEAARADTGLTPPPLIDFQYAYLQMGERVWMDTAVDAYRRIFGRLIAEGWKPDILHAHCAELAGIVAARLADEFDIPWVLTEHQVFILANYSEYRRRLMVDAVRAATQLVVVSYHQLRCVLLHRIDRPMVVAGMLVDEETFRFAEPRRDPTRFRILTVTYPSQLKDCETFFRAIAVLLERGHSDVVATVIGNDSFQDISRANTSEFERLAAKYGVGEVCRFVSYVPRLQMPKQYAECDAFVSTSIAETFGIAAREAMTVGRPVVCTASGGVEDDLSPVNGVKVNIRDHMAVADALIAIKTGCIQFDPVKIRDSIVAKHGRQAFLDQMTMVYEDAIASSQGRALRCFSD